jgi:hypothetical protein
MSNISVGAGIDGARAVSRYDSGSAQMMLFLAAAALTTLVSMT